MSKATDEITAEAAQVSFNAMVARWREIMPLGGARATTELPIENLHAAHVSALFPILVEDVYVRLVTCLVSESVPAEIRSTVVEQLATTSFHTNRHGLPETLVGKSWVAHFMELRQKMYWLSDDLDLSKQTIDAASDNLIALSRVLADEMGDAQLQPRQWQDLEEMLRDELYLALTFAGFVTMAEYYLNKPSLRPNRNTNFTVGVPKTLKRRDWSALAKGTSAAV